MKCIQWRYQLSEIFQQISTYNFHLDVQCLSSDKPIKQTIPGKKDFLHVPYSYMLSLLTTTQCTPSHFYNSDTWKGHFLYFLCVMWDIASFLRCYLWRLVLTVLISWDIRIIVLHMFSTCFGTLNSGRQWSSWWKRVKHNL